MYFEIIIIFIILLISYFYSNIGIGILISIIISLSLILKFIIVDSNWNEAIIYKKILLNTILPNIKPGDLVLFSSNKFQTTTRVVGDRVFSHIGIVIEKDNKLKILEITWSGRILLHQINSKGLQISDLSDRIYSYCGNVYIASLKKPTPNFMTDVNKILSEPYKFTESWKLPFVLLTNVNLDHRRFCSEYIADILNRTNISSIPWNSKKIDLQKAIVKLCDGNIYSDPIQIIDERLLIDNISNSQSIVFH